MSMVFLNKAVLGGKESGTKDAPLFVTWTQCVVTVLFCLGLSKSSTICPNMVTFPSLGKLERYKVLQVNLFVFPVLLYYFYVYP